MLVDIKGRVKNTNLPYQKPLLPLFEAVINSFQSLENVDGEKFITITAIRDDSQIELELQDKNVNPINSFIIEDNGVGFDDANYTSFDTSDSTYKSLEGGKGVGRFMWLKAFENVEVNSVFKSDNKFYKRKFNFGLEKGINNDTLEPFFDGNLKTQISLHLYKARYKKGCPKKLQTIAFKIIEHCLAYFLMQDVPKVILRDNEDLIDLNALCKETILDNMDIDKFEIKGYYFELRHLKLYRSEETMHKIHLCAHQREVFDRNLQTYIPNLVKNIKDENGKSFLYVSYLSGKYLDEKVNAERTNFNMSVDADELEFDELSLEVILKEATLKINKYLNTYLMPIKKQKYERISDFINSKAPQYKPVIKYKKEELESISPDLPEDEMELELYKISQILDCELKVKGEQFLKNDFTNVENIEQYEKDYTNYLEKVNDMGQANLVKYIIHRKLILTLLENNLKRRNDDKYPLEESVHKIIFPMRSTSDNKFLNSQNQNLWIIDEKLSYHNYLASDISMNKNDVINVNSLDRPDIFIFNQTYAFTNTSPRDSVVIIEFKRPMRNNYKEDSDNPIVQVFNYIEKIKDGVEQDVDGRPIRVHENTPFYSYIICDITPKLEKSAKFYGFKKTPDNEGYYNYNGEMSTYTEIISYDKLLTDANRRNKILFDKLFLSGINDK